MYVCMLFGTVIVRTSVISRLREPLREMIDPDFGLPEILMERGVLTDADRQTVKHKPNLQERNDELLNLVLPKGDTADLQFIDCLSKTDQHHVINYIISDGGNHCELFDSIIAFVCCKFFI